MKINISCKTYKTLHINIQSLSENVDSLKCILAHIQESNLYLYVILYYVKHSFTRIILIYSIYQDIILSVRIGKTKQEVGWSCTYNTIYNLIYVKICLFFIEGEYQYSEICGQI